MDPLFQHRHEKAEARKTAIRSEVIAYLTEAGARSSRDIITNIEIAPEYTVREMLSKMVKDGELIKIGKGINTKYTFPVIDGESAEKHMLKQKIMKALEHHAVVHEILVDDFEEDADVVITALDELEAEGKIHSHDITTTLWYIDKPIELD